MMRPIDSFQREMIISHRMKFHIMHQANELLTPNWPLLESAQLNFLIEQELLLNLLIRGKTLPT